MALRAARLLRFAEATGVTNRLLLTMSSPAESICISKPVDSVTVPGTEGTFTVTNNHSLIVSQLKPGVITVRDGSDNKDYFISDGFLFFNHPTDGSGCCTAEVSAVELVPTSALDKDRASTILSELLAAPKDTEWDRTKAALGAALVNQVIKAAE
uniref:ATP synthase F1 complex delta/epsilon subunit N-terminal domain-containing protein n=1 Tax=Strombidinopsis acuminata TaxID=141414 RepID=A0A7S3WGA5_9SPIT|mmetsp:Transcript_31218/g.42421  ORF Transcript_31218/g.42421 Transcript_31218/m.42421 type:complete len:155 (+) Transcript_31218:72-536(+)